MIYIVVKYLNELKKKRYNLIHKLFFLEFNIKEIGMYNE